MAFYFSFYKIQVFYQLKYLPDHFSHASLSFTWSTLFRQKDPGAKLMEFKIQLSTPTFRRKE